MDLDTAKTEVSYGSENTVKAIQRFQSNIKKTLCICAGKNIPALSAGVELEKGHINGNAQGVKIRYLTEIKEENIEQCRKIMQAAELRHLADITGSFAVSESEYVVWYNGKPGSESFDQLIHSNAKELVQQQQSLFDILWDKATRAENRFREIEQGTGPEKIEFFYGAEATTRAGIEWNSRVRESSDSVVDSKAPSILIEVEPLKNSYISMKERGVRIRWVTEITKDNARYCREAMKFMEVRHLDGIKGNFGVSESEYIAAASLEEAKPIPILIISSIKTFRGQQQYVFDTLWNKAVPAEQRIREIEENKPAERTEVIYGQEKIMQTLNLFLNKINSEVIIMATRPEMVEHLGRLEIFQRLVSQKHDKNFLIRLVAAFGDNTNKAIIRRISPYVQYKSVESLPMSLIMFIRDKREALLLNFIPSPSGSEEEEEEKNKKNGKSLFDMLLQSSDKLVVETMLSTFDAWWNQVENNDRMMEEKARAELLLDLITHDLGNHNQIVAPNLELAQMMLDSKKGQETINLSHQESSKLRRYITGAARGFERSMSLVDNIRRLEKMYRDKEKITLTPQDLVSAIESALSTVRNSRRIQKEIIFSLHNNNDSSGNGNRPLVFADNLLEEIFANLFFNAVKAGEEERHIRLEVDIQEHSIADEKYWMINISDYGKGIPDEMKSSLFTRFYSKAKGTGLGLSIARALVERYKGKVWAGDRVFKDYSKGAKFGLILHDASSAVVPKDKG